MLSDSEEEFSLPSLYPEHDPAETMAISEEALTRILGNQTEAIRSLFKEEREAHHYVIKPSSRRLRARAPTEVAGVKTAKRRRRTRTRI